MIDTLITTAICVNVNPLVHDTNLPQHYNYVKYIINSIEIVSSAMLCEQNVSYCTKCEKCKFPWIKFEPICSGKSIGETVKLYTETFVINQIISFKVQKNCYKLIYVHYKKCPIFYE